MANYVKAFVKAFNKTPRNDDPEPIISPEAAAKIRERLDAAVPAVIATRSAMNMLVIGLQAEIPFDLLAEAKLDGWFEDQIAQALKELN